MSDWKRYEEAKRLRDTGMTLKATGAALGVSSTRAGQMLAVLERRDRKIAAEAENPSLVPWWRGLKTTTINKLYQLGLDSRNSCMSLAGDKLTIGRGRVALPGWEEKKYDWNWNKKTLSLAQANEVRAWLGVSPYVPEPLVASTAGLERARKLLERHGWRVEPA